MAQDQPPLVQAVNNAGWNAAKRGPLLVAVPDTGSDSEGNNSAGSIPDIAAHFDRKLLPVGTLSALVPRQMTVLNPKPGKPELGQTPARALHRLLQSLSNDQWKLLGTTGLGPNDLTDNQRPYLTEAFARYSEGTFHFRRVEGQPIRGPEPVPAGFFNSARLKMVGMPVLNIPILHEGKFKSVKFFTSDIGNSPVTVGMNSASSQNGKEQLGGVILSSKIQEKVKPGDLDFRGLTQLIELPAGQISIKELMAAVSSATGLEIYADQRLENRAVWIWCEPGKGIPAGDVLRALARCLTGTYRRVDDIYVLTDDLEGLGTRLTRLLIWQRTQFPREESIPWRQWLPYASITSPAGVSITEEDKEKIRKGEEFPTSILSEKFFQSVISRNASDAALDSTRKVKCDLNAVLVAEVPGSEAIDLKITSLSLFSRKPVDRDAIKPVTLRTESTILLRASNTEEAKKAVDIVSSRKIKNLFLDIQNTGSAQLEAAQAAGKIALEKKISLKIVVSALQEPEIEESLKDINILGSNSPWYDPLNPDSRSRIVSRLKPLSKIEGVVGIVLRDFRAPGYSLDIDEDKVAEIPADSHREYIPYGFGLKNRKEILRQFHIDPIDVGPMEMARWGPPLFDTLTSPVCTRWRIARSTEALKLLEKELGQKLTWLGSEYVMPGKLPRILYEISPIIEERYDSEILPPGSGARLAYWLRDSGKQNQSFLLEFSATPAEQWEKVLQGVVGP